MWIIMKKSKILKLYKYVKFGQNVQNTTPIKNHSPANKTNT